ncbi:hypothetical protein [Nocardioides fonticola]|uniref:hypothetical protein n=1 Tax=Nocardioides fonticola TaxID=450363 RepID=UPI0031CF42A9
MSEESAGATAAETAAGTGAGTVPRDGAVLGAQVRRRGVVGAGGVVVGLAALGGTSWGRQVVAAVADLATDDYRVLDRDTATVVERVRRDADQLVLDVVRSGFREVEQDGVVQLEAAGAEPATLGFVLPAQSLGESYTHGAGAVSTGSPLVKAELGQPALLLFTVPVGTRIGYDIASLLDWSGLQPVWTGPTDATSLLEAPYRISVRPLGTPVWRHDPTPRVLTGADGKPARATELWHSRLTTSTGAAPLLRVVDTLPTSLKLPLDATDRKAILKLANVDTTTSGSGPVTAEEFIVSSLGASVEIHGRWPTPKGASLTAWDHRTTLGRDQYVKTVTKGFLLPWGHPAVIVEETWRRQRLRGSGPAARAVGVLEKVVTVVVTQPVVDTSLPKKRIVQGKLGGSRLPFASVRCTVRTSPPVKLRAEKTQGGIPRLADGGGVLKLPFVGVDWEGTEVPFTSTVGFMPVELLDKAAAPAKIWADAKEEKVAGVDLGGRSMALIPPPTPGSTRVQVTTASVDVTPVSLTSAESAAQKQANFRPVFTKLDAVVPAVSALAGAASAPGSARRATPPSGSPTTHVWPTQYLAEEDNAGGVFLKPKVSFDAPVPDSLTGGLGSLPQIYQGLSTKVGAVLAATEEAYDKLADGVSAAADIYDKLTLFGQIPLASIILGGDLGALPKAITEVVDQRQTVTTTLTPKLKTYSLGPLHFFPGTLAIVAKLAAGGDKPPEHSLDARLTKSTLELAGLVQLPVDDLHITSTTAAPFDLTLVLGQVGFLGPLAFVQQLAAILEPFLSDDEDAGRPATAYRATPASASLARTARRGFDPDIDVDLSGLHVSQSIKLPDVQVGVFQLNGLSFGFGVDLLFIGGLGARFNFATHENPFQVLYGPFGGGGYCAIELDGGSISNLEVSLAVCGGVGIDLGVAAGAISVSAGLVLALPAKGDLSLTGFFRASGALEVLGLVSVSVVFEISLTYVDSDPVSLSGVAELAMKIEVCWVSKTVHASVQKTFTGGAQKKAIGSRTTAGRAGAPSDGSFTFADSYPDQSTWASYAAAFAPGA